MKSQEDFLARIRMKMPEFSKGQRAIARYILSNYDKASYMTAVQLGKCRVSANLQWCGLRAGWGATGILNFKSSLRTMSAAVFP